MSYKHRPSNILLIHIPWVLKAGKVTCFFFEIGAGDGIRTRTNSLEGGDFILFAGIGSIFGPFSLSYIVFFGSMIGCLYYVFFNGFSSEKLPFGSFLILGSCLYFFIKTSELLSKLIVI